MLPLMHDIGRYLSFFVYVARRIMLYCLAMWVQLFASLGKSRLDRVESGVFGSGILGVIACVGLGQAQ